MNSNMMDTLPSSSNRQSLASSLAAEMPQKTPPPAKMTTRYTDEEWTKFIAEVEHGIVVTDQTYPCPQAGSAAFAKTIDHTLLKLEAKGVQFDALCAEARVEGFAVRLAIGVEARRHADSEADCVC